MADFKRIYREYLNTVKSDIEVQMRSQNRIASKSAIRSLRVVANQFLEAEIRGLRYIKFLEDGVGSQPKKGSDGFLSELVEWMRDKGIAPRRRGKIVPATETNLERAAGGIMNSLVRKGSAIKRGEHGLDIKEAVEENKPQLLKDMGAEMALEFKEIMKIKRR